MFLSKQKVPLLQKWLSKYFPFQRWYGLNCVPPVPQNMLKFYCSKTSKLYLVWSRVITSRWGHSAGWCIPNTTRRCSYKKMAMEWQTHTGEGRVVTKPRLEWCLYKPKTPKTVKPSEAGRCKKDSSTGSSGSMALLTPWFHTTTLQIYEKINFWVVFSRPVWSPVLQQP